MSGAKGAIIQLTSYGQKDVYLIAEPEITFFKFVYKRHTNFAVESFPQLFNEEIFRFNETITSSLIRKGDLLHKGHLKITLDEIIPKELEIEDASVELGEIIELIEEKIVDDIRPLTKQIPRFDLIMADPDFCGFSEISSLTLIEPGELLKTPLYLFFENINWVFADFDYVPATGSIKDLFLISKGQTETPDEVTVKIIDPTVNGNPQVRPILQINAVLTAIHLGVGTEVSSITIDNPGNGYKEPIAIFIPEAPDAFFIPTVNQKGEIIKITKVNGGLVQMIPVVPIIVDPSTAGPAVQPNPPTDVKFTVNGVTEITSITINDPGSRYQYPLMANVINAGTARVVPILNSTGGIASFDIIDSGQIINPGTVDIKLFNPLQARIPEQRKFEEMTDATFDLTFLGNQVNTITINDPGLFYQEPLYLKFENAGTAEATLEIDKYGRISQVTLTDQGQVPDPNIVSVSIIDPNTGFAPVRVDTLDAVINLTISNNVVTGATIFAPGNRYQLPILVNVINSPDTIITIDSLNSRGGIEGITLVQNGLVTGPTAVQLLDPNTGNPAIRTNLILDTEFRIDTIDNLDGTFNINSILVINTGHLYVDPIFVLIEGADGAESAYFDIMTDELGRIAGVFGNQRTTTVTDISNLTARIISAKPQDIDAEFDLVFSAPDQFGNSTITNINIVDPGFRYDEPIFMLFENITGAVAGVNLNAVGNVSSINLVNGGSTNNPGGVQVSLIDPGPPGPALRLQEKREACFTFTFAGNSITGIIITDPGNNYRFPLYAYFVNAGTADLTVDALDANGGVSAVTLTNPGFVDNNDTARNAVNIIIKDIICEDPDRVDLIQAGLFVNGACTTSISPAGNFYSPPIYLFSPEGLILDFTLNDTGGFETLTLLKGCQNSIITPVDLSTANPATRFGVPTNATVTPVFSGPDINGKFTITNININNPGNHYFYPLIVRFTNAGKGSASVTLGPCGEFINLNLLDPGCIEDTKTVSAEFFQPECSQPGCLASEIDAILTLTLSNPILDISTITNIQIDSGGDLYGLPLDIIFENAGTASWTVDTIIDGKITGITINDGGQINNPLALTEITLFDGELSTILGDFKFRITKPSSGTEQFSVLADDIVNIYLIENKLDICDQPFIEFIIDKDNVVREIIIEDPGPVDRFSSAPYFDFISHTSGNCGEAETIIRHGQVVQVILIIGGTGNDPAQTPNNIVRIAECLNIPETEAIVNYFYDDGIIGSAVIDTGSGYVLQPYVNIEDTGVVNGFDGLLQSTTNNQQIVDVLVVNSGIGYASDNNIITLVRKLNNCAKIDAQFNWQVENESNEFVIQEITLISEGNRYIVIPCLYVNFSVFDEDEENGEGGGDMKLFDVECLIENAQIDIKNGKIITVTELTPILLEDFNILINCRNEICEQIPAEPDSIECDEFIADINAGIKTIRINSIFARRKKIEYVTIKDGVISEIKVITPGKGYLVPPVVCIDSETGFGAEARAVVDKGELKEILIVNGGCDYQLDNTTITLKRVPIPNTFRYVSKLGHFIIEYIDFDVGLQRIDRHYGEWLNAWMELTLPPGKRKGYLKMICDDSRIYINEIVPEKVIYLPLQFCFNRSGDATLPIIALQFHEVFIKVKFRHQNDVYILGPDNIGFIDPSPINIKVGSKLINQETGVISYVQFQDIKIGDQFFYFEYKNRDLLDELKFNLGDVLCFGNTKFILKNKAFVIPRYAYINDSLPKIKNVELFLDYIHLDAKERRKFAENRHDYLIEQVQFTNYVEVTKGVHKIPMNFVHTVKELFWFVVTQDNISRKDWNNYTDDINDLGNCPISQVEILLNGMRRFKERESEYFNWIQAYQNHTNIPKPGLQIYNFGLFPENHQPSGTLNFSKFHYTDLQITIKEESVPDDLNPARLYIFARSYNTLRIQSGLGGLLYNVPWYGD